MTTQITLLTSHDVFTKLHELADGRRAIVKINREELTHLLIDHTLMYGALRTSNGFTVTEAMQRRERPKLRSGLSSAAGKP
jgi:hypothetical protein